jgi:hypothetical protein
MASSNSSLAEKSCACAYIAFAAEIFSWYADSITGEYSNHQTMITQSFTLNISDDDSMELTLVKCENTVRSFANLLQVEIIEIRNCKQ